MFSHRLERNATSIPNAGNNSTTSLQPPKADVGHIVYLLMGLTGLIISTSSLALRVSSTRKSRSLRRLSISHILVLAVMITGGAFSISTLFLYFGIGIYDKEACSSSMILCLVFYLGQKYLLYLFLVERTHVTQTKKTKRQDPIYITGLALILVGFTAIGISAFATFESNPVPTCTIGLLRPVAITVLSWDVFVNVFLTSVFLYYIQDFLVDGMMMTLSPPFLRPVIQVFRHKDASENVAVSQDSLVHVIRKTFWASVFILATTAANFATLLIFAGKEPVWLCFTLCTFDINWAVIIIFWLTEPAPSRSGGGTKGTQARASKSTAP